MDLISLTEKLISIPSYVNENNNEIAYANYLINLFEKHLPWLQIHKQQLDNSNRFNLLALPSQPPQLLFVCHMDTVNPSADVSKMLTPQQKQGKIFGLGSADMKGGTASAITAVSQAGKGKPIGFIFDCDEEYYFTGAKQILKEYQFSPHLLVFTEPTAGQIVDKCRGLIEVNFKVHGRTAHAGTPEKGINAIESAVTLIQKLKQMLKNSDIASQFQTSVNLSGLHGGRNQNGKIKIQSNAVPDIASLTLDIRPVNSNLTAEKVIKELQRLATELKIEISDQQTVLDYQGYQSDQEKINFWKEKLQISETAHLLSNGFFEASLYANQWNCPAISLGPTGVGHIPDESVDIKSLHQAQKYYLQIIENI